MVSFDFSDYRLRVVIIILLLLPVFIVGTYIAMFGVNVPYWDQWELLPILSHGYNHTITFQDLFAQHNEHRLFFPRLIMIGIAAITSYNNLAEMTFSFFLLIINFFLIYRIFLIGKQWSWESLILFIPIAWLVCSLHQWENLLWGFQIQIFLCVTGILLTILFLNRSEGIDWNLAVGIFGGILSSFSFMNGLMVWPTGLVLLLINEKKTIKCIIVWLVASIVTTMIFFHGWIRPYYHPSPSYFLSQPFDALGYFCVITGNSLGFSIEIIGKYQAVVTGILILFFLCFILYITVITGQIRINATALALITFAILSEVMLAIGRGGFGINQATRSRYVTFTILEIIGIYLLFINFKASNKNKHLVRCVFYLLCLMIFAGIFIGMIDGLNKGEILKEKRQEMRENLLNFQNATDSALKTLYPDPKFVRDWIPFLQKNKLNVFSGG